MKKRVLSIVMALALCLGMCPVTALAAEPADINMEYFNSGFVFAQGVPIVIKANGGITSIYDADNPDGEPLSGNTDVSSCAIYGGWFDQGNTHTGSTSVVMESGTVQAIFGGSFGDTLEGNTNVVLNGGTVGYVYGGSCTGTLEGNTDVVLNGGTVGWAYGGGNQSTVTGTARVTVNSEAKVWGQKRVDSSVNSLGTVFGGGCGGSVSNTEVVFNGGDAGWIYGGGDYIYDQDGNPISGCTCTNTHVKFMGQSDGFMIVSGGGNGGSVEKAKLEFYGNGVSLSNHGVAFYGGGWNDSVGEVQFIIGKNSTPSANSFCAKWNAEGNSSTVDSASFEVNLDRDRVSMMNSSTLDGTGVKGDVTATIYGDATTDVIFSTGLTEIDNLIVESGSFKLPSAMTLNRLEVKDSGTAVIQAVGGTTTLGTLAGSGTILFEKGNNATTTLPAIVNAVEIPEGSRIKVGKIGGYLSWTDTVVFQGTGITALKSASCFSYKDGGFYLAKTEDGSGIQVNEGTEQKETVIDPVPTFNKQSYQYGETMTITMGLKSEGKPVSGQTLEVRGGVSGLQTFASAVTGEDGLVSFDLPVDDKLWACREDGLQAIFLGTKDYKESFYGISFEGSGNMRYTVTGAQVALDTEITAPARGGVPVKTLTTDENAICTAEVLWSPADAVFRPEVVYTASIRLIPKQGYRLDGGRLDGVTYLEKTLDLPGATEADGSMLFSNVKTFDAIPIIHPTGVSLDKTSLTLTEGGTAQLTATVTPDNADNKAVTWTSDNPAVAKVDSSGKVTAAGIGTATITVTTADRGLTDTCAVTVKANAVPVTGVSLDQSTLTLTEGGTAQLTATVTPDNADNKAVVWTSGDTAVATVDNDGVVTAVGAGTATITVTTEDGDFTATCTVTVNAKTVSVTGVSLDQSTLTLTEGGKAQLTATVTPDNADNKAVAWSSDNPDVATVDGSGMVTAVGAGTATITVTTAEGNFTATCAVTVSAKTVPVTGVSLDKTSLTLTEGGKAQLTATVTPADADSKAVTWTSGDTAVATVDNNGVVTAVGAGTATITVTTAEGNFTATCAVTVTSAGGSEPDNPEPSEPDSSGPSNPGGSSLPVTTTGQGSSATTTTTTAAPGASVSGGTASATVNTSMGNEIVKQAAANGSEAVVIAPKVTGTVNGAEVSLPASTVDQIGSRTEASLTVSTPVADVTIPNGGLGSLAAEGGTVTVAVRQEGSTVELSVTAGGKAVGSIPGGLTLTVPAEDTAPGTVAVLVREDGTREVVRKSLAGDGSVTAPLEGSARLEIVDNSKQFHDVPATSWAADAVAFVSAHELFNGTAPGQFSPEAPMTRGMLAAVLHNLENNPAQAPMDAFADVHDGQWFAGAVTWAAGKGIVNGYETGMYGPGDNITREQLAAMLWRYAGSPAADGGELAFSDGGQVSGWALEAVQWAVENGVLNGHDDGRLDPGGPVTRAQAAQMLKNFMER